MVNPVNPTFQKANLGLPNANTPFLTTLPASQITQAWMMFFLQMNNAIAGNGSALEGAVQGIDDIADLRAQTTSSFTAQIAYVEGYYASGDGGEGFFIQSSTSTAIDDGGAVIVDASGRHWLRQMGGGPYNVLWWGAHRDGVTDDTLVFVAALAFCKSLGGGLVTMPVGIYYTTGVITVWSGCGIAGVSNWVGADYANFGATVNAPCFSVTNGGAPFITLEGGVETATNLLGGASLKNIMFWYPNQVTWSASAPIAYPPTIYMYKGSQVQGLNGVNPYQFISLNGGRTRILNCQCGAIQNALTIDHCYDYVFIQNFEITSAYEYWPLGASYGSEPLDTWVINNKINIIVYRCDNFLMQNITAGFALVGIRFSDSPDTTQGSVLNCYGTLMGCDMDTVVTGVQMDSANNSGGGVKMTNINIGSTSGSLPSPNHAIAAVTGGNEAPLITWDGGGTRGAWAGANPVQITAGQVYCTGGNIRGWTPVGQLSFAPAFPSSTFVQENFLPYPVQVFISVSGTVTHIKLNGVGVGAETTKTVIMQPYDTIEIDYIGTGGWVWYGM